MSSHGLRNFAHLRIVVQFAQPTLQAIDRLLASGAIIGEDSSSGAGGSASDTRSSVFEVLYAMILTKKATFVFAGLPCLSDIEEVQLSCCISCGESKLY